MPDWLAEGDLTVYFLLACSAVLFGVLWWRTRKRAFAAAAAASALAIVGVYLIDRAVESDREQLQRKVQVIADGVRARDFGRVFGQVSDSFNRRGLDKGGFRRFAEQTAQARNVTDFTAWNFALLSASREQRRAELEFNFKIQGNWSAGTEFFLAHTTWALDPDGEWRIQHFDVFNPYSDVRTPIEIPHWGR